MIIYEIVGGVVVLSLIGLGFWKFSEMVKIEHPATCDCIHPDHEACVQRGFPIGCFYEEERGRVK